jgi:hypothetical protein
MAFTGSLQSGAMIAPTALSLWMPAASVSRRLWAATNRLIRTVEKVAGR